MSLAHLKLHEQQDRNIAPPTEPVKKCKIFPLLFTVLICKKIKKYYSLKMDFLSNLNQEIQQFLGKIVKFTYNLIYIFYLIIILFSFNSWLHWFGLLIMALSVSNSFDCHISAASGLCRPHLHFVFNSIHLQNAPVSKRNLGLVDLFSIRFESVSFKMLLTF